MLRSFLGSVQSLFCPVPVVFALIILTATPGLFLWTGSTKLHAAPAGAIDQELSSAKSSFMTGKLQDARDALAKAQQHLAGLGGTAASSYAAKIQKLAAAIAAFEDSLVDVNLAILRRHGADSAFQYMQDVVWAYGVSRDKLDKIENTILNEAPAVSAAQERNDVAYALSLLESNQPMDPAIDPYIVKTAQMMYQARLDSLKKAKEAASQASGTEAKAEPPVATTKTAEPATTPSTMDIATPTLKEPPAEEIRASDAVITPEPSVAAQEIPTTTETTVTPRVVETVAITPQPRRTMPSERPPKPEEYTSPALLARAQATKEYLKKLKANQVQAQNTVVELYTMIENGQGAQAMQQFKDRRAFISKYVSPQVFNVLELTLAQTVIDAQKEGSVSQTRMAATSPEEQTIRRLEGLMRQNKVEAAYREFTREEAALKKYMPKKEFKLLKKMIEDAYELRTGSKKKK